MSLTLRIKLLGGFFLSYGERLVTAISTGRSQMLLAYLVLHRQAAQSRQRIAFHLWPESTDERARANLRKELSRLRHALPNSDEFLWVDAKMLQWLPNGNFTLDVAEFEAAVKAAEQATDKSVIRAELERAIELYKGDLLPDLDDEWVLAERERLQQMHVRALERLVNILEEQQDYQTALSYGQHLLRIDRLNEAAYCSLMRLYGLSGDRASALQVYHQCMTVLREELGVDPSWTTRRLYEQLLMEDEQPECQVLPRLSSLPTLLPSHSSLLLTPLVGREQEWAFIRQWASRIFQSSRDVATDAASEVLLLVGEPGIGKTRLLEELRATTQAHNARVLWGQGFTAEMMRPYGIWIDALRASMNVSDANISAELGFLLPELGQPSQASFDLSHLFDAVVQLLAQWANQAPLLVLLDDIQWSDEASSALLHYAIRLLRSLPVLFACTARTGELEDNSAISRVLQVLRREQRLQTIELKPLDREQTADLIRNTQAIAPSELSLAVVNRVFIDSGGNPLFALEIARSLGSARPNQTRNIEVLIRDRLHQLDDEAREILPWAAALGRNFQPTTLARVSDYPLPQLLKVIEQLEQQTIIRPNTSHSDRLGYDFVHDIVRQVIYRQLSEPRRQLVHLQIARKLSQQLIADNTLADEVAHHASLGGDHELAASSTLSAAERCLKLFAYAEAAKLAQRGIQHCQRLEAQTRIRLHLGLLRVWAIAGVTREQAIQLEADVQRLMSEASELGLKDDEAIGLEAIGVLYFNQSSFAGAHHSHWLRAVEVSRFASPSTAARLLAFSGSCLAELGRDMVRAEALLLEAQSLAARIGLQLCDIDSGLGSVHYHNGRYAEARTLLQQAQKLAQIEQDHWRSCAYLSYLAMTELEAGDPAAALPYCNEMAIVAAKIQGEGSEGAIAASLVALANYRLQHSEASHTLEQAIATLQQVDAKRMLSYVLIGAAETDLERDRPQLTVARAETALQAAQAIDYPSGIALAWAILIQGLLALGERELALARFEALRDKIERHTLSLRARTAVERIIQQMQKVIATSSRKSSKNS
ncbi:AAA family ATPase [Pleurocapsales cyanobacterium LEGE 06147]|nr:AAA family ATPase [Pleurocapsales cyanobacterium LEGE 06147]